MLNTNLFGLTSANRADYMLELAAKISIFINFFSGEISFGREANLLLFLHIADDEDRVRVVASNDLIDGDVALTDLGAGGVPADDAFFTVDAAHHVVHLLVVDVVEEPNFGLL
jgi:hypothetical protein